MSKISASTANKSYNKKTIAKMKKRDAEKKRVAEKSSELETLTAQAKGLGIDTAKADAMLAQTKAEGSKSFAGSTFETDFKAGKYNTVNTLNTSSSPITVPTQKTTTVPDVAANNAGLANTTTGVTNANGMLSVTDPYAGLKELSAGYQEQMKYLSDETPSMADIRKDLEKETGYKQALQEVENYTSQINTIVANRDAAILATEGQGRGITEAIIGGQQAQINKEAAIKALPIQAQLATAQSNLQLAQEHINTWGNILYQDALNKYNQQKEMYTLAYNFAVGIETRRLDDLQKQSDRQYQESQNNISTARNAALQAMQNGQTGLMKSFTDLDPNSTTFNQEYNRLLSQLRSPVSAPKRDTAFDKDGNLVDMQTGEILSKAGGAIGAPETAQKSLDQLTFLRGTAKQAIETAKSGGVVRTPVGPSFITRAIGEAFIGNTSFKQLQNLTDTLKTNVLALMTDPNIKKFFGPQMSNADVRLMSSTGSTLNPQEQTVTDYVNEVIRLDDLFNRMQTSVKNGLAGETVARPNVITAPDGTEIEIID